jgi:Fe-S-cluster-containing dehydrogenase component
VALTRRTLLGGLAGAGAAAAAAPEGLASERRLPPSDARGLLYDTTLCIGCKACVVACAEANGLEPAPRGALYQAPPDLDARTKNIIRLYSDGSTRSYVKNQCMHCLDPACVNACMLGALQKRAYGAVTYDASKCIGCRYCQLACPFNIPKFEWAKAAPRIVKCELCSHRLAEGRQPACTEVCPRQAVIFGTRDALLAEARRRLAARPDLYVPKVYGETDAGGTQVLYVSHVPFEKLGFPQLGAAAVPAQQRTVQHRLYRGFAAPVALYALLGAVAFRNRRTAPAKEEEAGS